MIQLSQDGPLFLFKGHQVIIFISNSVDPDDMTHYSEFHLGLHCLPTWCFLNTLGYL